jgi:hypothetical protein
MCALLHSTKLKPLNNKRIIYTTVIGDTYFSVYDDDNIIPPQK